MSVSKNIIDFISKHADLAVNIFHMMKSGKAEHEIMAEIKKTGNLTDKQAELIGAAIKELDKKGFEDEIRNMLGALDLNINDFVRYMAGLEHLYNLEGGEKGAEERDNFILCIASIKDPKLRSRMILRILEASYVDDKFNLDQFVKIARASSATTDPNDPFVMMMEKVDKTIKEMESKLIESIQTFKGEINKIDEALDKWENWLNSK